MRTGTLRACVSALVCSLAAATSFAADLASTVDVQIAAQPLASALLQLSAQTQIQIMTSGADVRDLKTVGISGRMTIAEALQKLLVGSGLSFKLMGDSTIGLVRETQRPSGAERPKGASAEGARSSPDGENAPPLEEVIVTGTHIQGVNPASPVLTISQKDIETGGFTSTEQLLQSLPQNSGEGMNSRTVLLNANGATGNVEYGTSVNLRGLGSGETLVLLNGHRMSGSGLLGSADISTIPVSMLKGVDVLTDGASATYGSDAVAGVVNFLLKDHLDGVEASATYGSSTQGGAENANISLAGGTSWDGGNILVSGDYRHEDPLLASRRDFSDQVPGPTDLTIESRARTMFVHADQRVLSRVDLYADALVSRTDRDYQNFIISGSGYTDHQTVDSQSITAGFRAEISSRLTLNGAYTFGQDRADDSQTIYSDPVDDTRQNYRNRMTVAELVLNGNVISLPAGDIGFAVGGSVRHDSFVLPGAPEYSRDNSAQFGEVNIPLVSHENRLPMIEALSINVSGRHEYYSGGASSTDPKIGVVWYPLDALKLRGTWGTSFRAPSLLSLYQAPKAYLFVEPDPRSPTGTSVALVRAGGDPALKPESATTRTFGLDYTPEAIPGLKLSATYYQVDFDDRIDIAVTGYADAVANFQNYGEAVVANPTAAQLNAVIGSVPKVSNFAKPALPTDATYILDSRYLNIATSKVSGVDTTAAYPFSMGGGEAVIKINGSKIFNNKYQLVPGAVASDRLDKVYFLPSFRSRLSLQWQRGAFDVAGHVNHTNAYTNDQVVPNEGVDALTTLDVHLGVDGRAFGGSPEWRDWNISLDVRNVFDSGPPFVRTSTLVYGNAPLNYDPANADPIGRFAALTLRKRW